MISYWQKDIYKNKIKLTFFAARLKIAGRHCVPRPMLEKKNVTGML